MAEEHVVDISNEQVPGFENARLRVPTFKMADGTVSLVLDPENVTFESFSRALDDVAPRRTDQPALREMWLNIKTALGFVEDSTARIAQTSLYNRAKMQTDVASNAQLLAELSALRPVDNRDLTDADIPEAGGRLGQLFAADHMAWAFQQPPAPAEPTIELFARKTYDFDATLQDVYQYDPSSTVALDSGGSGECFFCALAWQFDRMAPHKWRQYAQRFGVVRSAVNGTMLLRAIGTLGFLTMLRHPDEFTISGILSYGEDTARAGAREPSNYEKFAEMTIIPANYVEFQKALQKDDPRITDDAVAERFQQWLREYVAEHIAPTEAGLAAFSRQIAENVTGEARYGEWIRRQVLRPATPASIAAFCESRRIPVAPFARFVTLLAATLNDSLTYLRIHRSYVSTPHIVPVVRALGVSLAVLAQDYQTESRQNQVLDVIVTPGADFIARIIQKNSRSTATVKNPGGHFIVPLYRRDYRIPVLPTGAPAYKMAARSEIRPPEFDATIGKGGDERFVPAWDFENDHADPLMHQAFEFTYGAPRGFSHRLQRARRILLQNAHLEDEQPFACLYQMASYSYYQTKGPSVLFARIFAAIMTQPVGPARLAPMDHVRYLHRLAANMVERGTLVPLGKFDKSTPHVDFRSVLGVEFDETMKFSAAPVVIEPLNHLVNLIIQIVHAAVAAAATATVYYFCVPPSGGYRQQGNPHALNSLDYLYDEATNARLTREERVPPATLTKDTDRFHMLAARSRLHGFEMTVDMEREVYLFLRTCALRNPYLMADGPSAFYHHAAALLHTLFRRTQSKDAIRNPVTGKIESVPIITTLHPVPFKDHMARAAPVDMRFRTAGPEATHFSVTVAVVQAFPTEFTRRYHSASRVVVWLTRASGVEIAPFDANRTDSFERYLRHVQMAGADFSAGKATVTLRLLRSEIAAAQRRGAVYLHVAHMALETNPDDETQRLWVRSGHGFVEVGAISEQGAPLHLPLWEGPVDSTIAWDATDDYRISRPMAFKRTHVVAVSVADNASRDLLAPSAPGTPLPPAGEPNALYTRAESAVLVRYIADVVRRLPPVDIGKHSLLYLNMPLSGAVVPNWTSLLLPPVGVSAATLEARVRGKLFDESLTEGEFLKIAAMAGGPESAPLQAYARDRFVWIVTQIINPFNKVCYRFDRVDGQGNDQMQFPLWGSGDCEDTAEGVVRFIRGLKAIPTERLSPAAAAVLSFLADYEPAMTVMTTVGAKLSRTEGKTGLHMMAVLVPNDVQSATQPIIPVETTGLSFNSYVTPDLLLQRAPAAQRQRIIDATRAYNRVCDAANAVSKAVRDETINYAVLVNAEGEGGRARGESFIRPHHFYQEFVMLMRPSDPAFVDFRDHTGAIGAPFADVVRPHGAGGWSLVEVDNPDAVAQVRPLAQRYADNVMPAPDLSAASTADELPTVPHAALRDRSSGDVLAVRSVNFFVPLAATSRARALMDDLAAKLQKAAAADIDHIEPVDDVAVLGGAIEYYILRVRLR